jgi:Flp pilus assembly protein TadG
MLYRNLRGLTPPAQQGVRRTAAALIETAVIACVFLMLLFGVLEFCRFLFFRQLIDNAAREGARYAVVHTHDTTVDADTRAVILTKMNGMDQRVRNFTIQLYHADQSGNRITAYNSAGSAQYAYFNDSGGNYLLDSGNNKIYMSKDSTGPYVLDSSSNKVYLSLNSNNNTVSGVNAGQWSSYTSSTQVQGVDPISNAQFGQYIAVQISCDYDPITPALLRLGQTLKINVKSLMYSEAN